MNDLESISYPKVRAFLEAFLLQVRAVLEHEFVGTYLYGSLALGDFDPTSSDIDILVATATDLPLETTTALKALHDRIQHSNSEWAERLEVSYTPVAALRKYEQNYSRHPFISIMTPFGAIEHGRDWIINRYIIREKGVVLAGPSPRTLIDPISEDELKAAVEYILCHSWVKYVSGPEWLRLRKYQAHIVLTMCRVWYVLKHGSVVSKPQAAEWAQEALAPQWKTLIEQALSWRADSQIDDMTETPKFLRYTIEAVCQHATSL
jgi:predicted nucleotidyltransferase